MNEAELRELDELMAVNICKWWLTPSAQGDIWTDESGLARVYRLEWHPTRNITDAMQVVDAIGKMLFSSRLRFVEALVEQALMQTELGERIHANPFWWFFFLADKPLAICLAAEKIAERMGE